MSPLSSAISALRPGLLFRSTADCFSTNRCEVIFGWPLFLVPSGVHVKAVPCIYMLSFPFLNTYPTSNFFSSHTKLGAWLFLLINNDLVFPRTSEFTPTKQPHLSKIKKLIMKNEKKIFNQISVSGSRET